jgi:hypothetical protein
MAMSLTAPAPQADIGSLTVVNNCPKPVYYYVSNGEGWESERKEIPDRGLHIPYDMTVSVKLSHNPADMQGSISQLELDHDSGAARVWYSVSNVDAFGTGTPPFMDGGMHLTTIGKENAEYPRCLPVHCPKGERLCNDDYNRPDAQTTLNCPHSTSLRLVICPQSESPSPIGRPAKALHYNEAKKFLKKRNQTNIQVGGLTWQCCSGSSESHAPKLPVLGLVVGLASYFITML